MIVDFSNGGAFLVVVLTGSGCIGSSLSMEGLAILIFLVSLVLFPDVLSTWLLVVCEYLLVPWMGTLGCGTGLGAVCRFLVGNPEVVCTGTLDEDASIVF